MFTDISEVLGKAEHGVCTHFWFPEIILQCENRVLERILELMGKK
jgi:hypothetical protein